MNKELFKKAEDIMLTIVLVAGILLIIIHWG
jgi:hypothetical protein